MIEMILSYSFYFILGAYIILMYALIEWWRSYGLAAFATFVALVYLGIAYHNSDANIFNWITNHWIEILGSVVTYLVIGLVWSYFKWYKFVKKTSELYLKHRTSYSEEGRVNIDAVKRDFRLKYHISLPIAVSEYKYTILGWISAWPITLIVSLLKDPFEFVYRTLYNFSNKIYTKIIDNAFDSVKEDFNK